MLKSLKYSYGGLAPNLFATALRWDNSFTNLDPNCIPYFALIDASASLTPSDFSQNRSPEGSDVITALNAIIFIDDRSFDIGDNEDNPPKGEMGNRIIVQVFEFDPTPGYIIAEACLIGAMVLGTIAACVGAVFSGGSSLGAAIAMWSLYTFLLNGLIIICLLPLCYCL